MKKRSILYSLAASLLAGLFLWSLFSRPDLSRDEEVVFFPTSAAKQADGSWKLPIHGWVFEREEGDLMRALGRRLIGELVEQIGIPEEETRSPIFRKRIGYFLVDNQRGKQLKLSISSLKHSLPLEAVNKKSSANGHTRSELTYRRADKDGSWLTYALKLPKGDQRSFMGQIKLVPPTGLSVICDIDDTIKLSSVLNKKDLLRNSLFRPHKPVVAMSKYLWSLEKSGAYFHYVSAAPWQLYPSLKQFMDNNVPRGTVSLRNLRLKDKSFLSFVKASSDYKHKTIRAILQRYPQHQFVLVGDSGEHDPEVYGSIARAFPQQIKAIAIRRVTGADNREQRFADAFANLPDKLWNVREFTP